MIRIPPSRRARWQAGVTLIELMVALAIGTFLMIGAVTVFLRGRETFRLTESVSRLQENGRFALEAIEPDIRMAQYWGLTTRSSKIRGRAGSEDPVDSPDDCGADWVIDLDNAIGGSNNEYPWAGDCDFRPVGGLGASATSDTLVVRRVSGNPVPLAQIQDGTFYVQTARFQDGEIFVGAAVPAIPAGYSADTSETHQLVVSGYYVSQSSTFGNNVPGLRMKTLVGGGTIQDQEVLPGVEDMQVQFGVDTDPIGSPNRGSIDRYVNPGDDIITPGAGDFIPEAEILAVRVWLRLRAERPEPGYVDATTYTYADQEDIDPPDDGFRRILLSKTIYLRNARPAT